MTFVNDKYFCAAVTITKTIISDYANTITIDCWHTNRGETMTIIESALLMLISGMSRKK